MTEPDFDRLTELNDELVALHDANELTKKAWKRIFADAKAAVGEHTEFLEGLLMRAREFGVR